MWESISQAVSGPNGGLLLQSAMFLIVVAAFLSKRGLFSLHTKVVSLGVADRERDIIRKQQRFAKYFLQGLLPFIRDMGGPDYDDALTAHCLDQATIAVFEWITLNHISTDKPWVQEKQTELVNLVYSLGVKNQYRTPEFKLQMEEWTKELIEGMYSIRVNYK